MLKMINIHSGALSAKKAASRKYPKEAIGAVLNKATGKLMEYPHLLANPKYCKTLSTAYGKELGRLAQGIPGVVKGTTHNCIHK